MKLLSVAHLPAVFTVIQALPQFPLQAPLHAPPSRIENAASTIDNAANAVSVTLPSGTVIGSASQVETFNGIPYADPPKYSKSLGKFDATSTAPSCPGLSLLPDKVPFFPDDVKSAPFLQTETTETSEDCLTVTVSRPVGTKADDKLPVLFGIFGGGFVNGNSQLQLNAANQLLVYSATPKRPFIFVAVNYRAGAFGFLAGKEILADGASNLGLLDQRLALKWVADNIGSFGGDPDKVTIWGESAGSISAFDQMLLYDGDAKYNGKPLFHGAILNSGSILSAEAVDSDRAQGTYDTVVEKAGCKGQKNTLKCLRDLPYETFLEASDAAPRLLSHNSPAFSYIPRPDGVVLSDSPERVATRGQYHAVPVIIGTQEDEGTVFSWTQADTSTSADLSNYLKSYFKNIDKEYLNLLLRYYPDDQRAGSPFGTGLKNVLYSQYKRLAAITGDVLFSLARRFATELMAKTNPDVPVWSYISSLDHDHPFLGASHGSASSLVASGNLGPYYLNFLYKQDPNDGSTYGPAWPKLKDGNKFIKVQDSPIFPIVIQSDTFRDSDYEFVKNGTYSGYFAF